MQARGEVQDAEVTEEDIGRKRLGGLWLRLDREVGARHLLMRVARDSTVGASSNEEKS